MTEDQVNRRWVEILLDTLSAEKPVTIGPRDASCFINALRAILAAHPGQPEPADCGETLPGEYTNADDLIASLREPEPRAEVTDEQIADMFERVTGYSLENGRAALNDADILGFARELLEAARAGDAS
ncbi:hypothetical protein [Burkholderia multivorans]|uniref:hypothetical protein n=1 Tax=Burkholderia multivorans TaxID=87883 RepID=UPI001C22A7A0|nr:hypothetical protein [Burkholderia multivorans]MBU9604456.1 hypothetical protein [Burkholderia multivorans]